MVVVGGGKGVTSVIACSLVGKSGKVIVYEGGDKRFEDIKKTIELNGVEDICQVYHAVIGSEIDVYGGDATFAKRILPKDLPECDILELDCEGSEVNILQNITINPRGIIVELHPNLFIEQPEWVLNELERRGYKIVWKSGHEGIELSEKDFKDLLNRSATLPTEKNKKKEYEQKYKYLECVARWPVVVAGLKSDV